MPTSDQPRTELPPGLQEALKRNPELEAKCANSIAQTADKIRAGKLPDVISSEIFICGMTGKDKEGPQR